MYCVQDFHWFFKLQDEPFLAIEPKLLDAMKLNSSPAAVVLRFDGAVVDKTKTPAGLDLEHGDCIDVDINDWLIRKSVF